METNRCLNPQADEERVGDKRQKKAEKLGNILNAVEDINATLVSVRKSLTSLFSVRKSLASLFSVR